MTKFERFLNFTILKLNFATLSVKPQGNRWGYGARYINPIIGNVAWDSLKNEIQKVAHRGHAQKRPKIKKSRFLQDIATLDHHCSQTSNAIAKWLGIVVYLHVEKLQPRGHIHWRYRVASRMSQSRGISSEKSKKYFFLISSQNHLKRIENHF